jgi:hypothetical protein
MFTLALPNLLQLKRSVAMRHAYIKRFMVRHAWLHWPFFPEMKSRRFKNTVEATLVTFHYESLSFGLLDL